MLARRQELSHARGETRLRLFELRPRSHIEERTLRPRMAATPENAFTAGLFEHLPSKYDRLAEVLSFGQNAAWRRELVRHVARVKPRRILDVATGTAGVAIALANATKAE